LGITEKSQQLVRHRLKGRILTFKALSSVNIMEQPSVMVFLWKDFPLKHFFNTDMNYGEIWRIQALVESNSILLNLITPGD